MTFYLQWNVPFMLDLSVIRKYLKIKYVNRLPYKKRTEKKKYWARLSLPNHIGLRSNFVYRKTRHAVLANCLFFFFLSQKLCSVFLSMLLQQRETKLSYNRNLVYFISQSHQQLIMHTVLLPWDDVAALSEFSFISEARSSHTARHVSLALVLTSHSKDGTSLIWK